MVVRPATAAPAPGPFVPGDLGYALPGRLIAFHTLAPQMLRYEQLPSPSN